ncbi:hypothetical protein GCM10010124_41150 [Pilimelia terevasa]|uniref:Peptidase inhibitor family I36 n=1 Tax=Pilimelia terevasa TaxID=53372 RepID=A0A8J3BU51_9ACTN|nr:peptidase inhibitor family I36 protein [Pilimelia terevasa]GGK44096.1 hypothetical protein GCM10010124_41150 [Pilimelia terevasa]
MNRVTKMTVGASALLALLAPAVPANAADSALGWDCPEGKSCYYDGHEGTGRFWVAPSCGSFDLGRMNPPQNDKLNSVRNRGSGKVHLYNWIGSWDHVANFYPDSAGNLPQSVSNIVDRVVIDC